MSSSRWLRPAIAVSLSLALLGLVHALGLSEQLTLDGLRSTLQDAGPAGVLVYLGLFVAGTLASIPGLVFIIVAMVAWGKVAGAGIAFIGSILSAAATFCSLRAVGGQAEVPTTGMSGCVLGHVERHPVASVALLRATTVLSPPVNIALALSPVRWRDYMLGTSAGLILPIAAYAWFLEAVVARIGG